MRVKTYSTALCLSVLAGCASLSETGSAAREPVLQSDQQKSSYAQGVNYMKDLRKSKIELDQDLFVLGMNDVLAKKPLRLDAAELQKGQDWVFVQSVLYNQKLSTTNREQGQAFLAENKSKPGVVSTASGLQYKILEPGKAAQKPTLKNSVKVYYRISRLNGQELTNTYRKPEPETVVVSQLIPGWQEAMLLMPESAKWQIYVPSNLAYGESGVPGQLAPNETLIYDVTLVSIDPPDKTRKADNGIRELNLKDMKKTSSWEQPQGLRTNFFLDKD